MSGFLARITQPTSAHVREHARIVGEIEFRSFRAGLADGTKSAELFQLEIENNCPYLNYFTIILYERVDRKNEEEDVTSTVSFAFSSYYVFQCTRNLILHEDNTYPIQIDSNFV